jgi:hypothetical protein
MDIVGVQTMLRLGLNSLNGCSFGIIDGRGLGGSQPFRRTQVA